MTTHWTPGAEVQLQFNAHSAGFLAAWFDWNADGVFQETEQEIAHTVASAGVANLAVVIPAAEGYLTGQQVKARFRFYDTEPSHAPSATETFDDFGGDGEVERSTPGPSRRQPHQCRASPSPAAPRQRSLPCSPCHSCRDHALKIVIVTRKQILPSWIEAPANAKTGRRGLNEHNES